MPRRSRWRGKTGSRSSSSRSSRTAGSRKSCGDWGGTRSSRTCHKPTPEQGSEKREGTRRHGARRIAERPPPPHGWRARRAAQGVRRAAHRPSLGQPVGADHGQRLWRHGAAQSGGQRQRAGAADDHGAGLGPRRGQGGRPGDPRIRAWPQPADRGPGHAGPDPGAQRGAAPRIDPRRGQIRRAGARVGAQCPARRDRGAAPPRKGQRDLAGRAAQAAARRPTAHRRPHQAHRRDARAKRQGNPASLMSVAAPLPRPLPRHIAIIMDGNGRWAKARGLPRVAGHRRGAEAVRRTLVAASELGIPYLTLFGFSSENWKRPLNEVDDLMGLLRHYLRGEIAELHRNGVRLRVIGETGRLSADLVTLIANAEALTRDNRGVNLTIALSYGGRAEIAAAVRAIAAEVKAGQMPLDAVDEDLITRHLFTADLPDPDLLIRTSGEQRISNFLLWQCAYAELVFTKTLWPDFGRRDLDEAIADYCGRERRYGASVGSR